ncbi:hypothetical protein LUZ60_006926 [Juncus effusus]|nr:hypothetical protein LUZ60_006926 [Juncus effusus]
MCCDNWEGKECIIHSSFFSCDELNHIDLTYCYFLVPSWFKEFKLLHTLLLKRVIVSRHDIEKLISRCPHLKKLILIDLTYVISLNIHASELVYLELEGDFLDLRVSAQKLETSKMEGFFKAIQISAPNLKSLEIEAQFSYLQLCAPKLVSMCIDLFLDRIEYRQNSIRFIGDMPDLKSVQMKEIMYLSIDKWLDEFMHRLNYLSLFLNFEHKDESSVVLALFQRALYLQTLHIDVCSCSCSSNQFPTTTVQIVRFWETVDKTEDLFKQLNTVKIVNFTTDDSTVSFVKFILGSAQQLETLTINKRMYCKHDPMMFKELLRFPRVSPKAAIVF